MKINDAACRRTVESGQGFPGEAPRGIEQMLQTAGRRDIMSARIAEHDWEAVTYAEISSRI